MSRTGEEPHGQNEGVEIPVVVTKQAQKKVRTSYGMRLRTQNVPLPITVMVSKQVPEKLAPIPVKTETTPHNETSSFMNSQRDFTIQSVN